VNAAEPTRAEVLGWMTRTGRGAAEAVDHFWAGTVGPDRQRLLNRVRKWAQLERDAGNPSAPPRMDPAVTINRPDPTGTAEPGSPQRPAPDLELARLDPVALLERLLADLAADLAWARAKGLLHLVASLNKELRETSSELQLARAEGGRVVALDRSPAAVADEVERRAKRLAELAAKAREREL
jgi:hypothetical protein